MKKCLTLLLTLLFMLGICPAGVLAAEMELYYEGQTVFFADFENEIPESLATDKTNQVIEDGGSKVYVMDCASRAFVLELADAGTQDCMVELDFKQASATGSSAAQFSIGVNSGRDNKNYRFAYNDLLKFDRETGKVDTSKSAIRDVLSIMRSNGGNSASDFYYPAISPTAEGILNVNERKFSQYYRLTAIKAGNKLVLRLTDRTSGRLLSSLETTTESADFDKNGMKLESPGGTTVIIGGHSSTTYIDNIVVKKLEKVSDIQTSVSYKTIAKGYAFPFSVTGVSSAGAKELYPPAGAYQFDNTKLEIDARNRMITPLVPGKHRVEMNTVDVLSGQTKTLSLTFEAADTLEVSQLYVTLEKENLFLNAQTQFMVRGVTANGDEYDLKDYDMAVPTGKMRGDRSEHTLTGIAPGSHTVEFRMGAISESVTVQVCEYEKFALELAQPLTVLQTAAYQLYGVTGEQKRPIEGCQLDYDDTKLSFDTEAATVTGLYAGEFSVKVDHNGFVGEVYAEVADISSGIVIDERFETEKPSSSYFLYEAADIKEDNGNRVYHLQDKVSPLFGHKDWKDYEITMRMKIVEPRLDQRVPFTSFEIVTRRGEPDPEKFGGGLGVPLLYRLKDDKIAESHMRINTYDGPELEIADGNWHDVAVVADGNQLSFTIDGVVFYQHDSFPASGGFELRAQNCGVYLDDVKVVKTQNSFREDKLNGVQISESRFPIDKYASKCISSFTAIKLIDSVGGHMYISDSRDIEWSIIAGEDAGKILDKNILKITPEAEDGDEIVLKGIYRGFSFETTAVVRDSGLSEYDYVTSQQQKRKESIFMRSLQSYNLGQSRDNTQPNSLSPTYGKIYLHPKEQNYDDIIQHYIDYIDIEHAANGSLAADFFELQLQVIHSMLNGVLNVSPEIWRNLERHLYDAHYTDEAEPMSENHRLVYFVNALITMEKWPDHVMWNGKTGAENYPVYVQYLMNWINRRMKYGMGEYDSGYYEIDIISLVTLHAVTNNQKLRTTAQNMLDYLYADLAVDSIGDVVGGAGLRRYAKSYTIGKLIPVGLHFDNATQAPKYSGPGMGVQVAGLSLSEYLPDPVVMALVRDSEKTFENKERKQIYQIPDDPLVTESLKKYSYVTPNYVMGGIMQEDILLDRAKLVGDNHYLQTPTWKEQGGTWVLGSFQEIPFSLVFGNSKDALIFDSHPGKSGPKDNGGKHGYFTGDFGCIDYRYFQKENVALGMHKITDSSESQFTHFWIPKTKLDRIDEEDGWIFIQNGGAMVALRLLKDGAVTNTAAYEWGDPNTKYANIPLSDIEAKTMSPNTAFICEAADLDKFEGGFEAFKAAVKKNEIDYVIDSENYYIEYTGLNGKTLRLEYDGISSVDGISENFSAYKLHESPYLNSDWGSGEITISHGDKVKRIVISSSDSAVGSVEWKKEMDMLVLNALEKLRPIRLDSMNTLKEYIIQASSEMVNSENVYLKQAVTEYIKTLLEKLVDSAVTTQKRTDVEKMISQLRESLLKISKDESGKDSSVRDLYRYLEEVSDKFLVKDGECK